MQSEPWSWRSAIFSALGGVSALLVYLLLDQINDDQPDFMWRISAAVAIVTFGLLFVMVCRRSQWISGLLFSLVLAAMTAGISYWRLSIEWPHAFNFMALMVAVFIASPFYQTTLHSRWNDYRALHHHAWGNAVMLPLGGLFVGLTFAVAYLLAELFSLVGIEFLKDWLRVDEVLWVLGCASLGAAIGVLREHEVIIGSTQRLVQSVFSLLAAPLALGLGGFLLVLPFTGLEPLWDGTSHTSATLFACAAAALVFVNSVVREDADNQSDSKLMQVSARALALCLAPLALITGIAIKLRVEQYGWTPDRLWAVVLCVLVIVYGVVYLLSALQRIKFMQAIRQGNIYVAILVCAVAAVLATPWLDFGAYSTTDQIARFKQGKVTEDKLDLAALAFDFGPAGRKALEQLKADASQTLARRIESVQNSRSRHAARRNEQEAHSSDALTQIRVLRGPSEIPAALLAELKSDRVCRYEYCYLLWSDSGVDVALVEQNCQGSQGKYCQPDIRHYSLRNDRWAHFYFPGRDLFTLFDSLDKNSRPHDFNAFLRALDKAASSGSLELRPVQRMQVFIDGTGVGPLID